MVLNGVRFGRKNSNTCAKTHEKIAEPNDVEISKQPIHEEYVGINETLVEPSHVKIRQVSDHTIELSWKNRSNTLWSFTIEKKVNDGDFKKAGNAAAKAITWKDETVIIGNIYQYRIKATAGEEESIYAVSNTRIVDGELLSAPTNFTATVMFKKVILQWEKTDKRTEAFRIFRSEGNQPAVLLATITRCSFTDTTTLEGTTYSYCVVAFYRNNLSPSIQTNITTLLQAPSSLNVAVLSENQIKLMWQNNSTHAEKYEVQRAPLTAGDFSVIDCTKQTSFIDDSGMSWRYRVRCYMNMGNDKVYSPFAEFEYSYDNK
jgi:fibronectin type 3 domain-containing protein